MSWTLIIRESAQSHGTEMESLPTLYEVNCTVADDSAFTNV